MPFDSQTVAAVAEDLYTAFFEALPVSGVLVKNDPPKFTIVTATPSYLVQTGYTKEAMIGKGVFDALPVNKIEQSFIEGSDLLNSYLHVSLHKEPHSLPVQRYDLQNGDGSFTEKYWQVSNRPVLNTNGDVAYIIHTSEDFTKQVKAQAIETRLNDVEKAFSLFMHAPMVVGLVNGDDYILEMANEAAFKFWGKSSEIIGKPILESLPELKGQGILELFDQVRTSGQVFFAKEVPVASLIDGKEEQHYFDLIYQPYYSNGSTKATGVFTISHNISEQVYARKAVQESEAKYRSLFESMDQGFCVFEMIFDEAGKPVDYRFLEVNPMFEKQTGLVGALGRTARELVPNLESHWFHLYGEVALTGDPVRFTEGSEAMGKWFDVFAFPIGDATSRKVALLFTDVSEHKKAEEALKRSESNLRNMILQSPNAMAILRGPSFIVEIANDRMYELWGRSQEHLLHKSIFLGLPEVKDQGYEELLTRVYTTGKTFSALGIPVTLPRNEGIETVYINLLYEAFREADGSVSGIMVVAADVTEQVLARQKIEDVVAQRTKELAQANEELRRSNQNLEEFAHAASHDLKEPVRKIHFYTHQLKDQLSAQLQEGQARAFNRIENATERMGNLIDDLLLYSHVSHRPHEMESIDLNQKVQRVLEDLELEIEEKKAVINVAKLPTVNGYRRQLQQLFQNLISNALKYKKADVSPCIDITAGEVTENGRQYHYISIKDNGIGFEQEYAEKIFQMFTRLHGKSEYSGTGVGLSIVKKVVENHNGFIRVESTVGEGATFSFLLPAE